MRTFNGNWKALLAACSLIAMIAITGCGSSDDQNNGVGTVAGASTNSAVLPNGTIVGTNGGYANCVVPGTNQPGVITNYNGMQTCAPVASGINGFNGCPQFANNSINGYNQNYIYNNNTLMCPCTSGVINGGYCGGYQYQVPVQYINNNAYYVVNPYTINPYAYSYQQYMMYRYYQWRMNVWMYTGF